MRRRGFLSATIGGAAALTGCIGTDSPGTPVDEPRTPGRSPSTPTSDSTSTVDVTVEDVQLQYGVVTPDSPDSIGIFDVDTPYLVASVRVDGPRSRDEFGLEAGGVSYPPTKLDRLYRTSWGDDRWYERGRNGGLLLFEPPRKVTGSLRLTWPGGAIAIDEAIVARLDGSPPVLSASLELPAKHDSSLAPDVEIEATNEGETAGRFLGALNRIGPAVAYTPVARLSELVPPGATVTIPVPDSWSGMPPGDRIGDGEPDVTYHLGHADGEDSARIRLVDSS